MKYSELQVWQKAIEMVVEVYKLTTAFPREEKYGLVNQMQRAAVSVPANIAEGHGRKSTNAFLNHLSIANSSLMELETHVQISMRLNFLQEQQASNMLAMTGEIGKMINGLRNSLAAQSRDVISES